MLKFDLQFFADDDSDLTDLTHDDWDHDEWDDLSDAEADEIMGIENGEEEGVSNSFLEDEHDDPKDPRARKKPNRKYSDADISRGRDSSLLVSDDVMSVSNDETQPEVMYEYGNEPVSEVSPYAENPVNEPVFDVDAPEIPINVHDFNDGGTINVHKLSLNDDAYVDEAEHFPEPFSPVWDVPMGDPSTVMWEASRGLSMSQLDVPIQLTVQWEDSVPSPDARPVWVYEMPKADTLYSREMIPGEEYFSPVWDTGIIPKGDLTLDETGNFIHEGMITHPGQTFVQELEPVGEFDSRTEAIVNNFIIHNAPATEAPLVSRAMEDVIMSMEDGLFSGFESATEEERLEIIKNAAAVISENIEKSPSLSLTQEPVNKEVHSTPEEAYAEGLKSVDVAYVSELAKREEILQATREILDKKGASLGMSENEKAAFTNAVTDFQTERIQAVNDSYDRFKANVSEYKSLKAAGHSFDSPEVSRVRTAISSGYRSPVTSFSREAAGSSIISDKGDGVSVDASEVKDRRVRTEEGRSSGSDEMRERARIIEAHNIKHLSSRVRMDSVKSLSEQTSQKVISTAESYVNSDNTAGDGVSTVKNSAAAEAMGIILSEDTLGRAGARSAYSSLKYKEDRLETLSKKASEAIDRPSSAISAESFAKRDALMEALKNAEGLSSAEKYALVLHRKAIYQDLTAQKQILSAAGDNKALREFAASGRMFSRNLSSGDLSLYKSGLDSYLRKKGLDPARVLMDKKALRHPEKFGLTKEDVAARSAFMRKSTLKGLQRSARGNPLAKPWRLGKMAVRRTLEKEENSAQALRVINTAKRTATFAGRAGHLIIKPRTGLIAVTIKSVRTIGRVTGITYVGHKIGRKIADRIQPRLMTVKNAMKTRSSSAIRPVKEARDKTLAAVKRKFSRSAPGRGISAAKSSMQNVSGTISNSRAVIGMRTAAKKTATVGKKAVEGTKKTVHVLTTPLRLVQRFFGVLHKIRRFILIALGVVFLPIIILYSVLFISSFIGSLAEAATNVAGDMGSIPGMVQEIWDTYMIYEEYVPEMEDDVNMLKELDEEVYAECEKLGEGHPITDEVLEGHHIDRYGSPDKEKGYTITYLDAYGNELPSMSTNIKDVESIAMAMINNSLGEYDKTVSYAKDLENLDLLLRDMYELMVYHDPDTGKPYTYEESEIYVCAHGCDEYEYYCNDYAYYSRYDKYMADGCGHYEDLEPYDSKGCEVKYETSTVDGYWDYDGNFWSEEDAEKYWDYDPDYYLDADVVYEGSNTYTEEIWYCPGHTVPICYGHRDIDIYVTLYDTEYVIENWRDFIPEDVENKPYYYMIEEFLECDGFDDVNYSVKARNFVEGDWYEIYGILVEGAEFSTRDSLTPEEVQAILDAYDGDISAARADVIRYGLQWVGKIAYQWGGKASEFSDNARFGSSTPDYKGRKNGLDCSGFVQFVFGTSLGVNLPSSTAGYSGYSTKPYSSIKVGDLGFVSKPGAKSNHLAIYMGKNASGQDQWLECNGSKGACITTSTSYRYFIDVLGQ